MIMLLAVIGGFMAIYGWSLVIEGIVKPENAGGYPNGVKKAVISFLGLFLIGSFLAGLGYAHWNWARIIMDGDFAKYFIYLIFAVTILMGILSAGNLELAGMVLCMGMSLYLIGFILALAGGSLSKILPYNLTYGLALVTLAIGLWILAAYNLNWREEVEMALLRIAIGDMDASYSEMLFIQHMQKEIQKGNADIKELKLFLNLLDRKMKEATQKGIAIDTRITDLFYTLRKTIVTLEKEKKRA